MVGPPEMPERPKYISSTGTSITLQIMPVADNNGAHVTKYYLFRDGGDYSTDVNIPVTSYDGQALTHTVTGLTPGLKYRFVEQAENAAGKSVISYETIIVAAELPSKSSLIEKVTALSNKTSIHVKWSRVANTETETTGYLLKMAEFGSSDFKVIYDGYNRP